MKVTLHIESPGGSTVHELGDEITIGRTPAAQLVLDDGGLSRVNTIIFREGDEILVTDENSTNGTFLNGERISGQPKMLRNGDRLKIGSHTEIRVEIDDGLFTEPAAAHAAPEVKPPDSSPSAFAYAAAPPPEPATSKPPFMLIAAIAMTVVILVFGGIALLVATNSDNRNGSTASKTPPPGASRIPVRVIDPLGGEDEDDLDDLIASWETAEEEIKGENVADVTVSSTDTEEADLNVISVFLQDRQRLALEGRPPIYIRHPDLNVPAELSIGFRNQTRKLQEMNSRGYRQPMDFAELAEKRLSGDLIEMPMAAQSFYLDVGGSASTDPFTSFTFAERDVPILVGAPKYGILSRLADNFAGHKYDLNNPLDRKQMRMRLLRMFNKRAKPILKELADAYFQKYARPLRVTSLTRSMDYQIGLNRSNANSFKVTGEGSLPPHTSGCAFDLARKHMPPEEQNFLMNKLAEMERTSRLDALIEYGQNACFHIFIYDDGRPPR